MGGVFVLVIDVDGASAAQSSFILTNIQEIMKIRGRGDPKSLLGGQQAEDRATWNPQLDSLRSLAGRHLGSFY